MNEHHLRIGELSRRVGVSPDLLRAWERRYGLLRPNRTSGGFRLYSEDDVARVRRMQELLDEGLAASEAARLVRTEAEAAPSAATPAVSRHADGAGNGSARGGPSPLRRTLDATRAVVAEVAHRPERVAPPTPDQPHPHLQRQRLALVQALETFDDARAQWLLDRVLAAYQLEAVLSELLLPYLHELGERWEAGEVTVAQEHFASNLVRARLLALAHGWDRGDGPRAVLACPTGEQHDLPLVMFGLALRRHGWRITFLGADTPVETLRPTAEALSPDLIVLAAADPARLEEIGEDIASLGGRWQLAVAGRGATREVAERLSARLLEGDPVTAAAALAAGS